MHATDIVGYIHDGAVYCEGRAPAVDDEDVTSPIFAGDEGWEWDVCDTCHWPLDDNHEVHGAWHTEQQVTLCGRCWHVVPESLGHDVWPIMDGWSGPDECDGCGGVILPQEETEGEGEG